MPSSAVTNADIKPGNAVPLKNIPLGSLIHNVELKVGRGGQIDPFGRYLWTAYGQGRRLCSGTAAFRRGEEGLIWNAGPQSDRSAISIMRISVSAKPAITMAWEAAKSERCCHESGRSSDGRRRGQIFRWATSLYTMGRTDERPQDENNKNTDKYIVKRRG